MSTQPSDMLYRFVDVPAVLTEQEAVDLGALIWGLVGLAPRENVIVPGPVSEDVRQLCQAG